MLTARYGGAASFVWSQVTEEVYQAAAGTKLRATTTTTVASATPTPPDSSATGDEEDEDKGFLFGLGLVYIIAIAVVALCAVCCVGYCCCCRNRSGTKNIPSLEIPASASASPFAPYVPYRSMCVV